MSVTAREREIEARQLLLVGVAEHYVAEITGLDKKAVHEFWKEIDSFEQPYTGFDAAKILGVCSHTVFRSLASNYSRGAGKNLSGNYQIKRTSLEKFAEDRLKIDGLRRARYLLFLGKSKHVAAIRARTSEKQINRLARELEEAGASPNNPGPFTVKQASVVLGLQESGRQVRGYCEQGRLGHKWGMQWHITRDELIEFGGIERKAGPQAKSA